MGTATSYSHIMPASTSVRGLQPGYFPLRSGKPFRQEMENLSSPIMNDLSGIKLNRRNQDQKSNQKLVEVSGREYWSDGFFRCVLRVASCGSCTAEFGLQYFNPQPGTRNSKRFNFNALNCLLLSWVNFLLVLNKLTNKLYHLKLSYASLAS